MKKHLVITGTSPPPIFFPVKAGLRKSVKKSARPTVGTRTQLFPALNRSITDYAIVGTFAKVLSLRKRSAPCAPTGTQGLEPIRGIPYSNDCLRR